MTTQTASTSNLFEQAFENFRKAAEANIEMQQKMFQTWNSSWPGVPQAQGEWQERFHKFQKSWAKTVKDVLSRHREDLDEQYGLAISALEEAFHAAQSSDPQELAKRCEALFRKTLDVLREVSEMQANELQQAMNKWTELLGKNTKAV
jgi:hypothetical protein